MAFGIRISGLPAIGDEPIWTTEAPWWREAELRDDARFEDASWCPGYADYEAVMTVGEVKALAAKYAAETLLDHFKERMDDLERKLANHDGRLDRVRITVFEWSSGL